MSVESDSEDDGYSGMELPTLIKQLKSVLDQYPDDGQILKELIQNAEDAEASKVEILYDGRDIHPHIDSRVLKKRKYLAALQAPALCVYNNALFTDKDWRGIKMLHNSIKEEEPLKVGRFGLGFKSVFHVTDIPCIISGDTILFINPQERSPDRVCYMKKLQVLDNDTKKILQQVLEGTFGFCTESFNLAGTLFWFPLRAEKSKLSDTLYTEQKVMDLFKAFKAESSITLLFLKFIEEISLYHRRGNLNMEEISLYHRRGNLNMEQLFTQKLSDNCLSSVRDQKSSFVAQVKELNGRIPTSSLQNQLILEVEIHDHSTGDAITQKWMVINYYKGGNVSTTLKDLNNDPSLSYCPYVGLAVPLGGECKGHVFCFLPLPLENRSPTGLAVHVNGFFALSQNRRYVKWPTADQLSNNAHMDKAIEWNKCLVHEVLPNVYCCLLERVIQFCHAQGNPESLRQQVYSQLPNLEDVDQNWRPLLETVYGQVVNMNFLYTQVSGGRWISLQDSILLDKEHKDSSLICEVFLLYNKNIVLLSSNLLSTLRFTCGSRITEVDKAMVADMLKQDKKYTNLPREKKLDILKYLENHRFLHGLQLLPVADGTFVNFNGTETVYFCEEPNEAALFPGVEHLLVSENISSNLQRMLRILAQQGVFSLAPMSTSVFPDLLRRCISNKFPYGNVQIPSASLNVHWLKQVWNYISKNQIDVRYTLSGLSIVPDIDQQGRGQLHHLENLFIAKAMPNMNNLPELVSTALQKLGVTPLAYVPDFVFNNPYIRGKVVHYPTPEGVINILENLSVPSFISGFNEQASRQERNALLCYLSNLQPSSASKEVLKKLKIFSDTSNCNCDVETVTTLAPTEPFPVPYPQTFIQQTDASKRLAVTLGATQHTLEHVCSQTLHVMNEYSHHYTQDQVITFMEFLLNKHQTFLRRQDMKDLASRIKFLTTEGRNSYFQASELFDSKDSNLRSLFIQEDKFPSSQFTTSLNLRAGLMAIGLKTEKDVTESDIIKCCQKVEELVSQGNMDDAECKVKTIFKLLDKKSFNKSLLSTLKDYKCIPTLKQKPSGYPASLPLESESAPRFLKASELVSFRHLQIVGSVYPVAVQVSDMVENMFDFNKLPPSTLVIKQLRTVSDCYQSKENHTYSGILHDIYRFLSSSNDFEIELMQSMKSVWIEGEFQYPAAVYTERAAMDLNLKPYRFLLTSSLQQWKNLMIKIGCQLKQTADMLATVLQEIKEKHDSLKSLNKKSSSEVNTDLKLILQIVGVLKDLPENQRPRNIFLPTHQEHTDYLVLLPLEDCTFCNADWLRVQTSEATNESDEAISYVHADISENTARQLGISSLTDRVMGDTEDLDMDYHQSEPLTNRLKYLLREYTDGFSVPKELIQNADDAGATEVCFLYDERQNINARTFLMHEGMSSLQGPAFWAYNNASFKESDFTNITKLSGATKEEDATKVGKFGLGFNSVYNLTDVPSFISENTVVIFDPHKKHLGRSGLKANLKSFKNQLMLRKMYGQFKPFEGIFGCNLKGETICSGTLFRFPLRTGEQALSSEIKKLSYSQSEMDRFFQVFVEGCGNLVLFTQNVKSVKFYHLPADGDPASPQLLVHTAKEVLLKTVHSPLIDNREPQNVLSFVNEQWKRHSENRIVLKITERSNVKQEIFDSEMTRKHKRKKGSVTVPLQITWASGIKQSADFASAGKLKGLVPLAGISLALQFEEENIRICHMKKNPEGFYTEGHLFCFLPLPVKAPFQVHINAGFALTPDRRHLCTKTEDDKILDEAQWNEALMSDAVSRAYVSALSGAPLLFPEDINTYYDLWPVAAKQQPQLVKGFYKIVTEEEEDVFVLQACNGIQKTSFCKMRYLDPKLCNGSIGEIAFKAAEHFWKSDTEYLVKMSGALLNCFEDAGFGNQLHSRCFTVQEFFENVFLPNIADQYWSPEERDKLTLYALDSSCTEILELLKNTRCIPTRPSGTLKKPSELIHPYGKCHRLFEEEDECFPSGEYIGFGTSERLSVLTKLGMVRDDLPGESLLERASSVAILKMRSQDCARKRCREIISYVSSIESSSQKLSSYQRFSKYSPEIREQLQQIPFVPILHRPTDWPLPWKADENNEQFFACAIDLHARNTTNLVGSSRLIIDDRDFSQTFSEGKKVLGQLGLKEKHDLAVDLVMEQLNHFSEHVQSNNEWGQNRKASEMCNDLYEHLNSLCQLENSEATRETRDDIHQYLGHKPVILTGGKMVFPKQVAFELKLDLSPYLFKVELAHKHFSDLFETLGVRKKFEISDLVESIKEIQKSSGSEQLTLERLQCFGRLIQHLLENLPPGEDCPYDMNEIYLPDEKGYLCEASELCINDCDMLEDDPETMRFVHPLINSKVANWFGVKGKREADLYDDISLLPFGQSEKLTTRLKRILDGYPCDASVMKELLQNADDASATELMFIKDFRSLPTDQVISEKWKELQGPALCVYNNSYFSDSDFTGIQNLGEGSKGDDPVKTGQYGVGFNAVYHLTDVPSFMTVGPNTEKTVCALDPHTKFVPWANKKKPGGRINKLDGKRSKYKDFFSGYLEDCVPLKDKGTLFRFPLRNDAMAAESDICNEAMTTKKVTELLEKFKHEMFESLLFLHCIKKITIAHMTEDGKLVKEYWVESKMNESDIDKQTGYLSHLRTQAKNVKDHTTGVGIQDISPLEIQLSLSTEDSNSKKQNWLIVHNSGFSQDKPLPESLLSSWERGDIGLLPRGGVAVPLPSDLPMEKSSFIGKAFCILPLPIETGLPLHVNGHFALDHEARRNLWHGSDDYRCDWNKHTLDAIIIPAYISAFHALKKNLNCTEILESADLMKRLNLYYGYFPCISKATDRFWTSLSKTFYLELVQKKTALFSVMKPAHGKFSDYPKDKRNIKEKVQWVPLSVTSGFPGFFNTLETYFPVNKQSFSTRTPAEQFAVIQKQQRDIRILTEVLRDLGLKVIQAPKEIHEGFVNAELTDHVQVITPERVIQFLKSHNNESHDKCQIGHLPKTLRETPLRSLATVKLITKLVTQADSFVSEICMLPLAVTSSETLKVFNTADQLIVTKYDDLLVSVPEMVVHRELTRFYINHASSSASLRPLTLDILTELMPQLLEPTIFKNSKQIPWDTTLPTKIWLLRFWEYLGEALNLLLKEQETRMTSEWIRNQLKQLETWCLFPARFGTTNQLILYPLTETTKILHLDSVKEEKIRKTLQKLNVPLYDNSIWIVERQYSTHRFNLGLANHLLGTWDRPGSILYVLSEVDWSEMCPLKVNESDDLLIYFSRNLDKLTADYQNIERLLRLPFYENIFGKHVRLKNATLIKDSSILIKDGMKEWTDETCVILVKHNIWLDGLYEYVGYKPLSLTQLYSQMLIPHFNCIPSQFKAAHIKFIRMNLLQKSDFYSDEQKQLINQLKVLNFIETSDGTLHRASDFYCKQEIVFSTMLPPSAFLPRPYDDTEWQNFLVLLGLHAAVTEDDFVYFATEIQRLGAAGISKDVIRKAVVLMKHLWQRTDILEEGILHKIKDIKFILPYCVKEEHPFGQTLIDIHPQLQEAKHLICFSESVSSQHCLYVWTSSTMFRDRCNPNRRFSGKNLNRAYSQLGISNVPPCNSVVQHVQNVCDSVTRKQRKMPLQGTALLDTLKAVMSTVYGYFQENSVSKMVKEKLQTSNTILLLDEKIMVAAMHVVTKLDRRESIPKYLFPGPTHFGQFFPLFHKLGASEEATSLHFAQVLNNLRNDVGENEMHPNELEVARLAMMHMFRYLMTEKENKLSEITSLYLPSSQKTMTLSSDLVYDDNIHFKEQSQSLNLNYFIGFRNIKIYFDNSKETMSCLPKHLRPKFLTEILKEVVSETCKRAAHPGTMSRELYAAIQTTEFRSALMRLINDAKMKSGDGELTKSDCQKIESNLENLVLLEVENLHTVSIYNGTIIDGSEKARNCFSEWSDGNICIYLSAENQTDSKNGIYATLALAIDRLVNCQLGANATFVMQLLTSATESFVKFLDSWHIRPFDYLSSRVSQGVFPPPGTIIEEKFHFILDNNFGYFEEGEYAGFEVYDPLIDEADEHIKDGVFLVYVIVKKVLKLGDTPLVGRYLIEGKDGHTEEVSATQLYKFIRDKENLCTDVVAAGTSVDPEEPKPLEMKDVLAEIRKILKDAWANLVEKERNRVKKRLYLKWHPDKNPHRKDFCTEVCKYIALYVEKLEKGEDIDEVEFSKSANTSPDFSWFHHFDARSRKQRNFQDEYEESYRSSRGYNRSYGYSFHQSARSGSHPQPLEAQRWFRQAKADLDAALETLGLSAAYNWICFKCQQATEKALKAVLYNRDATCADNMRSHDLSNIVKHLGNPGLTMLVSQLQNIILDYNRLRYPDRLSYPRIPADVYTEANARTACELTKKILSLVEVNLR